MNQRTVEITRLLDAPRERVFAAWTQAEHLMHWFGPKGFSLHSGEADPRPGGVFRLCMRSPEGQDFIALNGGPHFTFSPAISFFVSCKTQEEVDELWEKLSAGGEKQPCGWLKDKYGVSWQIIPTVLGDMLQMKKIDIKGLKEAYGR